MATKFTRPMPHALISQGAHCGHAATARADAAKQNSHNRTVEEGQNSKRNNRYNACFSVKKKPVGDGNRSMAEKWRLPAAMVRTFLEIGSDLIHPPEERNNNLKAAYHEWFHLCLRNKKQCKQIYFAQSRFNQSSH